MTDLRLSVCVCVCVFLFSRHYAAICAFTHSQYPADPRFPADRSLNWPHFRVLREFIYKMTNFFANRAHPAKRRFSMH